MTTKTSDQPELALDPAEIALHGDPDFEANDPGDIGTVAVEGDGDPEPDAGKAADPEPEIVKAADGEEVIEPAEDEESPAAKIAQLEKANKALGKRISVISKEKRDLSTKLQENIKAVPKEEASAEPDATDLERSNFKTQAEFDAAVVVETNRRLAVQEFNGKCNAVEEAGAKAFGDKWGKAKADLAMLDDQGRIPFDLLTVALETDNPAQVLFVLGNDIEKATELMGLTPIKRAIAMDKIASAKPAADAPRSKAPPPVDPIGGRGSGDDKPTDRDTDEEWNRKEEARERRLAEARRARGY